MKSIFFLMIVTASLVACKTEDKKLKDSPVTDEQKQSALSDPNTFTSIDWLDSTALNIGKVKRGEIIEIAFRFKNTGNKQLVIAEVKPGCGCTVSEKPEKPFAPGEEGVIKAKFDSKGQGIGEHHKYITVTSNTNPTATSLQFTVEVTE